MVCAHHCSSKSDIKQIKINLLMKFNNDEFSSAAAPALASISSSANLAASHSDSDGPGPGAAGVTAKAVAVNTTLASSPGPFEGRRRKGLVHTDSACANGHCNLLVFYTVAPTSHVALA